MRSLLRFFTKQARSMTSPAGVCTQVAVPDAQQAVATAAAAAKQLQELAQILETQGPASACHVGSKLQLIAQQLQLLQPAPTPAAAAPATQHTADAPSVSPIAAAPAADEAAGHEAASVADAAAAGTPAAAADVDALERSYAAPAVPGAAADTEDLAALQPLTKKQRRGASCTHHLRSCFASIHA